MIYVVAYKAQADRDITPILNLLQASPGWAHNIDNVWLIASNETAKALYERLASTGVAERILITELSKTGQYFGALPKATWDWIEECRAKGWG